MIWLIRDKVHVTEDMKKATHILDSFTTESDSSYMTNLQLTAFLNYARKLEPKLLNESKSKLLKIYEQMRNVSAKSKMPVGVRQLEALVRLSMAYAKLNLKEEVCVEDVVKVEQLMKKMYEGFGQSLENDTIQQQIYFDKKNTKQHDLISIWNGCRNSDGNVKIKTFQETLMEAGMGEDETKRLIDRWENNNVIKLNNDGTYKRI